MCTLSSDNLKSKNYLTHCSKTLKKLCGRYKMKVQLKW